MNIFLWILQVLLALHTLMGAIWKFTNPEQAVGSLAAIPHSVWIGISIFEIFLAVGLILPAFKKSLGFLAPVSALCIAAIMFVYTGIHLFSGETDNSPLIYWLVVAAICGGLAYGRYKVKPI